MRKAPKLPVCTNYELYNGNAVAVLFRNGRTYKTETCPFCAKVHTHGFPNGHRDSHCSENTTYRRWHSFAFPVKLTPDEISASDDKTLKREHGYIIRTKLNQTSKQFVNFNSYIDSK